MAKNVFLVFAISLSLTAVIAGLPPTDRDFAARWSLGDPTPTGDDVLVSLTVVLTNESRAPISGAVLVVTNAVSGGDIGAFPAIDLGTRSPVTLSADFVVPVREFNQWRNGGDPTLCIELVVDGQVVRRGVEMTPDSGSAH